jgi:hypothetical protein
MRSLVPIAPPISSSFPPATKGLHIGADLVLIAAFALSVLGTQGRWRAPNPAPAFRHGIKGVGGTDNPSLPLP